MPRPSRHVEPTNPLEYARHYIRELVYGANDGLITTFAVVAGVAGGGISSVAVLIVGTANLLADGLSMAVGNYLGIKSERAAELQDAFQEWEETRHAARHGSVTWVAFALAGLLPLLPYFFSRDAGANFWSSTALAVLTLFTVGALRTCVTPQRWWRGGGEMLLVGALASGAAYLVGNLIGHVVPAGRQ